MNKMFGHRMRGRRNKPSHDMEESEDNPPGYEGKEHVKYKDPGYTRHEIKYPEDEPHMKSHVSSDEEHEMEDNFHMDVPDQTEDSLPAKIKRARMKMDSPTQQDPKKLLGNQTTQIPLRGVDVDDHGEEEMGPNDMQGSGKMPKSHRKKMIVAVMKKKMSKKY